MSPLQELIPHRPKRSFHRKVKTGCKTCKIRRVRCDEEKPSCARCVSTGRKCDGYDTPSPPSDKDSSSSESSTTLPSSLSIALPQQDPAQVRSFRYFLHVAAPAIAGSFHAEFWTEEIPRACHADPAIWHAIVSLGAVYEDHGAYAERGSTGEPYRNLFALRQFGESVQYLTRPGRVRGTKDKWRALVLSTIFTCVCSVEGLYEDARIHFESGCRLFAELDEGSVTEFDTESGPISPVSLETIRSMLIGLDMRAQIMGRHVAFKLPDLLTSEEKGHNRWQSYTPPSGTALTTKNLHTAKQVAESLFTSNVIFIRREMDLFRRLFITPSIEDWKTLLQLQKPLIEGFERLNEAVLLFSEEIDQATGESASFESREFAQLRLSYYFVLLYVAATRLFVLSAFTNIPIHPQYKDFETACLTIGDLSDTIFALEDNLRMRSGHVPLAPSPPIASPLSLISVLGPTKAIRDRALLLLERPRMEGFFDGAMLTKLGHAIAQAEVAAEKQHRRQEAERIGTKFVVSCDADLYRLHPTSRMLEMLLTSLGRRRAILQIQTWRDWLDNVPGMEIEISW